MILSYLQADESAGYHYIHAGRRHKILGSGTKDFIMHGTASSMSISLFLCPPCLPRPAGAIQWAQIDAAQVVCSFHS